MEFDSLVSAVPPATPVSFVTSRLTFLGLASPFCKRWCVGERKDHYRRQRLNHSTQEAKISEKKKSRIIMVTADLLRKQC